MSKVPRFSCLRGAGSGYGEQEWFVEEHGQEQTLEEMLDLVEWTSARVKLWTVKLQERVWECGGLVV